MDFFVQNAIQKGEQQDDADLQVGQANIKVFGAGGAGNNMVNWLYQKGIEGAEIIACNTDKQHLDMTQADRKFLIGTELTKGLGAGGHPQRGEEAAKESINEVRDSLKESDMVFVCAGLGGGTGSGAAHVIAKVAKDVGSIVIGTVTMPFKIERVRIDKAEYALQQLRNACDTVIVIDNNRLASIAGNLPLKQAFAVANELIATMIKGIVETIAVPSLVNLDFADVKAIMTNGEVASIGVGASDTADRVKEAVKGALSNPLLDIDYAGATGAIIHICGGEDLTLDDITKIGDMITEKMDTDANVIWGARVSDDMKGKLTVMTIITGVTSPWILGKYQPGEPSANAKKVSNELGIDLVN